VPIPRANLRHHAVVATTGKLDAAVEHGMLARLAVHGYEAVGSVDNNRGSSVELSDGSTLIVVTADWLEGEIEVTVNADGRERRLAEVVDLRAVRGLHLRRLRRGVTADVIGEQLAKVTEALLRQAPELFGRP
jgi:hypothetical protein